MATSSTSPPTAYRAIGYNNDTHTVEIKQDGDCKTVNCGRYLAQSQFNLRLSKSFRLRRQDAHRGDRRCVQRVQRAEPRHRHDQQSPLIVPTTGARRPDAAPADLVLG